MYPIGLNQERLDYWAAMTDDNLHTEVLIDICDWAQKACIAQRENFKSYFYEEAKELFLSILNTTDYSLSISKIQYHAAKMLFEGIANDFGQDVSDDIWKFL